MKTRKNKVRHAILKAEAKKRDKSVPDEIIDLLCKRIFSNKRDLTAALNMVIAYTEIMELPMTVEIVDMWLRGSSLMLYIRRKHERKIKILQYIKRNIYGFCND